MIAPVSGSGMRVGRISRPPRGVGEQAMPDAGLDTTQSVESVCEVPPRAGVLQLLLPGMVVGVIIDRRCVLDRLEVTHRVISTTRELFSKDEGAVF